MTEKIIWRHFQTFLMSCRWGFEVQKVVVLQTEDQNDADTSLVPEERSRECPFRRQIEPNSMQSGLEKRRTAAALVECVGKISFDKAGDESYCLIRWILTTALSDEILPTEEVCYKVKLFENLTNLNCLASKVSSSHVQSWAATFMVAVMGHHISEI